MGLRWAGGSGGSRRCGRAAAAALILLGCGAAWAQEPAAVPAAAPAARFPVLEYRVQGNTVLPQLRVEEAVYPHLGTGRTAEDIEAARKALEDAYNKAGYPTVTVEVPQQRIAGGIVTLQVVERPVGRLRVTGARWFLPGQVRAGAPSVAEGKVPNIPEVQRDIVALNRLPDRRVTPQIRPGAAPDTVDVDLEVEDRLPLHASAELNNRQTRSTRELRVIGAVRYDNLWQRGDSINFAYQTAPQRPSDASVYSGSYLWRVPGGSASVLASIIRSDSDVATVGGTTVIGKGTIAGLRGIVPLGFSPGFTHSLSFGADYKSFRDGIILGADRAEYPITYYPFTVTYQASWAGERATTDISASFVWAFRGLGSNTFDFTQKRAFAQPGFSYIRADAARLQNLPWGMQLYGHATGQYAREPLIANEQFALGGLDSVRGYFEVETLGDFGAAFQGELRSPSLAPLLGPRVNEVRLHAFFDVGAAGINHPLPQQNHSFTLASTGVGARMRLFDRVNGQVEGATTLTDGADTKAGNVRALFRIWGDF
ncbi:MAG TPA: ShlB/FhaC/HecB family hemolysin secretion/activation protein [Crenalkalicoccus sp.]|jgi:hemolysin activation/secretion protein|nr:ShlB/FhaC/HecB family hemolysin secretion/activation protein [Crenalkalicoccus sp.]